MQQRKGFTLLELLVVIAIIGVLITIGVQSYTALNKQARDGRRASDLQTIRTALESYRSQEGEYPPTDSLSSLVDGGYLQALPVDPQPDKLYGYTVFDHPVTGQQTYALCAAKELPKGTATDCTSHDVECIVGGEGCTYQLGPMGEQ